MRGERGRGVVAVHATADLHRDCGGHVRARGEEARTVVGAGDLDTVEPNRHVRGGLERYK